MNRSIASAFLVLAASCTALAAPPKRPNILFIVADDLGYADVGFQGCKDIPTPNLDALATSGVRFTNGYVSGPYCSPTRAGLMTGRYQTRFGHEFNPEASDGLPLSETTIADRLKAAGYVTGLVGKWHLGSLPQFHPQKRGFDEFFGFLGGAHDYFRSAGILRGTEPVKDLGLHDRCFRSRGRGVHRAAQSRAVVSLPGLQRRAHADAGHRRPSRQVSRHRQQARAAPMMR